VNKTAAIAAQLAKCILLHAYYIQLLTPSCASTNKNFIANLASWHYINRLRTIKTENP